MSLYSNYKPTSNRLMPIMRSNLLQKKKSIMMMNSIVDLPKINNLM